MAGPFGPQVPQLLLPNQGNQLTPVLLPNGQQEQLGPAQDPNNPNIPQQAQNPMQVTKQPSETTKASCNYKLLNIIWRSQ